MMTRMTFPALCIAWLFAGCGDAQTPESADGAETAQKSEEQASRPTKARAFELNYGATLKELPEGAKVRVWVPIPQSNEHQSVKKLATTAPEKVSLASDATYGNRIGYFETTASGDIVFNMSYRVERREARSLEPDGRKTKLTAEQKKQFLAANRKVPLSGKHVDLLRDVKLQGNPVEKARQLYDQVDRHVTYDKTKPGYGNGDVLWVCDSRTGNCTDFHSLFISWSRANEIPARFEIGFPLPPERGEGNIGGYHCWAMFHTKEHGWVPVDISEADKHPEMKDYYLGI